MILLDSIDQIDRPRVVGAVLNNSFESGQLLGKTISPDFLISYVRTLTPVSNLRTFCIPFQIETKASVAIQSYERKPALRAS